jgi:hypothetical protein
MSILVSLKGKILLYSDLWVVLSDITGSSKYCYTTSSSVKRWTMAMTGYYKFACGLGSTA